MRERTRRTATSAGRRSRTLRRALPGALAAAALCACPGMARAAQETVNASAGAVTATLTYQQGTDSFGNPTFAGLQLRIARAGTVLYERPVRARTCGTLCAPETFAGGPLQVADLDGDGEPEVVLRLNTQGAHCCSIVQVLSFDASRSAYAVHEHDFGDPGAVLTDVAGDGRLELESADDRFAYEFASFAYSGLPLQIWRFRQGSFIDVTRSFRKPLAADAKRQFKRFVANRRRGLGLGFIAAWAADEELLEHRALVSRTLAREARLHRLRSADRLSPGGRRFIKKLRRFLHKTGYA